MHGYILSTLTPLALSGADFGPGYGWGWHMMPFGFGGFGMIFWMIALVLLLFWVLRRGASPGCQARETPLEVLKRRYAAGEITREQFQEMKKDLE